MLNYIVYLVFRDSLAMPAPFDYLSTRHDGERASLVEFFDLVTWNLLEKCLAGYDIVYCGAKAEQILFDRWPAASVEVRCAKPGSGAC